MDAVTGPRFWDRPGFAISRLPHRPDRALICCSAPWSCAPEAHNFTANVRYRFLFRGTLQAKPGGKIADDDDDDAPKAKKPKKMEKREDEGGFFQMEKKENSFVYIQGLPTEDFDEEKLVAFMSKCGVVAQDDKGVPKVKLYRSSDTGDLKGDGAWPVL